MYANPSLYDRSNYLQVRDGAKMIALIRNEFQSRPIDTILDIGCGTGNLTEMMYHELKPKRIVAFDLAQDMITYANQHSKGKVGNELAIDYYQADACDSFEILSKKLNLKPSSVDVITSFYCIHWVPDKRQTCENMFKFLKPNGKFFLIISVWNEFFPVQHQIIKHIYWRPFLTNLLKERAKANQSGDGKVNEAGLANFEIESKPNHDSLHQFWRHYCLDNALVMEEMNFIYTDYPFKRVQDFNDQVEAVCYWLNYIPLEKHQEFLNDYFELIQTEYIQKQVKTQKQRRRSLNIIEPEQITEQRLLETMTTEQEAMVMFRFDYIYATIVGRKPSTSK